jgi:23S rRNA (uracil1939-C5)-methyltransferase
MKKFVIEGVEITDIADKGRAFARFNDKAVFIEGAVPGDLVDVEIYRQGKSFDEGKAIRIISHSPNRTEAVCSHFGICGGCKWQNLSYTTQLQFKEKHVHDAMQHIGGLKNVIIHPIIGSQPEYHYRNKLEFTFTSKRYLLKEEMNGDPVKQMNGLGFHIPGRFNKVMNIDQCYLQDERSDAIRNFVRETAIQNNLTFSDLKLQEGFLRNLVIRNTMTDEWMVIVVFRENISEKITSLMNAIKNEFPWITSLQYFINQKRNDSLHDQQPVLFHGRECIIEKLENLSFLIGPKSFFQTNSAQALVLYQTVRKMAGLTGTENVYDLYSGTGSIAAFVSANAKKVTGVEYVQEAVDDAQKNANLNNISNMSFYASDMKDLLTVEFFNSHGVPDVIITDPPRAGMHESVTRRINESGAKKIIYVSCNPSTQARDLQILSEKYSVEEMQPVDMFPHTSHVENVALLKLNP